jgi:hypothetical protein
VNVRTTKPVAPETVSAAGEHSSQGRVRWRRFLALLLLAQVTLFWEGCQGNQFLLSLGAAGPAATISYSESPLTIKLVEFSAGCFAGNLLAIGGAILIFVYAPQHWMNRLASRKLLIAAAIVTAIFNSILYFAGAWAWLVMNPILWIGDTFFHALRDKDGVLGTIARVYFVACVLLFWGLLSLLQTISRRYFFVHADRWQFSLGGLLALMVILGTGIGMLLRLLSG